MKSILTILALVSATALAAADKPVDKPAAKVESKAKAAEAPKPAGTSGAFTQAAKDAAKPEPAKK